MTDSEAPNTNDGTAAQENAPQQQAFALQRIYLKDVSFEAPMGAMAFTQEWNPQINLDMNMSNARVGDGLFEVVLSLTVNATIGEENKTAFLVEVAQAGIFLAKGMSPQQLHHMLGAVCPTILFPYAREAIDNLVAKGSFPPLMLAPMNFEALYANAIAQASQQAADQSVMAEGPSSVQ